MSFEILQQKVGSPGPVRGVLFDMDGVILDTEKLYARFWMEACRSFGYPMTYAQALGMRSLNREAGQRYLSSLFGDGISHPTVREKRIALMNAFVEENGVEAKPGVAELLDCLSRHSIPHALATASPVERVRNHLGRLGLLERFPVICTAYDVPHGKPEPDIYLYAAEKLGLMPGDCIAVEDSYTGMLSASRAGCRAVIVPDLDQPDRKLLDIAWGWADSLADLTALFED